MTGIIIKRRNLGADTRGRKSREDEGGGQSDTPTGQSLPGNCQGPEERLEQALPPERINLANTLVLDLKPADL